MRVTRFDATISSVSSCMRSPREDLGFSEVVSSEPGRSLVSSILSFLRGAERVQMLRRNVGVDHEEVLLVKEQSEFVTFRVSGRQRKLLD